MKQKNEFVVVVLQFWVKHFNVIVTCSTDNKTWGSTVITRFQRSIFPGWSLILITHYDIPTDKRSKVNAFLSHLTPGWNRTECVFDGLSGFVLFNWIRDTQVFVFWEKLGNLARFWQSCKILVTWQDFGNVAKYMQELLHALGNQARF